jgi:hypothetical protein
VAGRGAAGLISGAAGSGGSGSAGGASTGHGAGIRFSKSIQIRVSLRQS